MDTIIDMDGDGLPDLVKSSVFGQHKTYTNMNGSFATESAGTINLGNMLDLEKSSSVSLGADVGLGFTPALSAGMAVTWQWGFGCKHGIHGRERRRSHRLRVRKNLVQKNNGNLGFDTVNFAVTSGDKPGTC
ncbi:MAG: hypothetical protein MZV49_09275 [Rhodopseudomonas palustris]|nr:hypothetical protein [Rhodopseudomonas palustris]